MRSKTRKYVGLVITLFIAVVAIVFFTRANKTSDADSSTQSNNITSARSTATIEKDFQFPIKDDDGKEVSRFTYTIEGAELRDEIVVKGQKATSIDGRTFLLINLKLSNTLDRTVQISTKDYIRLIRNGNPDEQLAPDVHNDPVEVQAISTKLTRLAFPINKSDTDLHLQIGEITGEKELVPIVFN